MDNKLKQALAAYFNTKEPRTALQYESVIKEYFTRLKILKLSDITEQSLFSFKKLISTYKNHKGELKQSASNTVYKKVVTVRNLINHLKRHKLINQNIVSPEPPPVSSKIPALLTQTQCLALLASPNRTTFIGHRDYIFLKTALMFAMRLSTLQNLKFSNFVKKYNFIVCEFQYKGNRRMEIRCPQNYYEELKTFHDKYYKEQGDDVFIFQSTPKNTNSFNSGKLSATSIKYLLNKYKLKAHIDPNFRLHPHLLRHQAISMLLFSGKNISECMAVSGHKNIQTTYIYLHNLESLTKDIVGSNILFQKKKVF